MGATASRIAAQKSASPSGSGASSAGSLTSRGSATGMTREPRVSTIRAVPSWPALSLSNTAYRRSRRRSNSRVAGLAAAPHSARPGTPHLRNAIKSMGHSDERQRLDVLLVELADVLLLRLLKVG